MMQSEELFLGLKTEEFLSGFVGDLIRCHEVVQLARSEC